MKIAVTYQNGEIFQHFGQSQKFKIYDVECNKILGTQVLDTNGAGHGDLADFLKNTSVDTLICGGIGGGAISALSDAGIKVYAGVKGKTDDAVNAYIKGTLNYTSDANCSHHEHDHNHGECGSHGCGSNGCH